MIDPLELSDLFRSDAHTLEAYADALRGHVHAGFRILEVIVAADWMPQFGNMVAVTALIDAPPDGVQSWPSDQRLELEAAIRRAARQLGILEHLSIRTLSLRSVVEARLPADVIARARLAAERPFEPEET